MKTKMYAPKTTNEGQADLYQMITDRIIEGLEKGKMPWKKTWTNDPLLMPQNYLSKKIYNGLNLLLLAFNDYEVPFYLTFNQIKELGGSLKKGSKSTPITYWNFSYFIPNATGELVKISPEDARARHAKKLPVIVKPFLRYYNVFNIENVENIDFIIPEKKEYPELERINSCEEVISNYKDCPLIKHSGTEAFYSPIQDYVNMPEAGKFDCIESYYGVLFHELIHSTGHAKRLNREEITSPTKFGSQKYSKEELTAEIGSMFLRNLVGLENYQFDNSQAYINGWITALKNDKMMIFSAASKAKKAISYMKGIEEMEEGEE